MHSKPKSLTMTSMRECVFPGASSGQLGWTPWGEGFLLIFTIWFTPIRTKMSHPLGVGHFGGWACKDYFLGGLFYVSNTLHVCTTPQQHCSTSLLHEHG